MSDVIDQVKERLSARVDRVMGEFIHLPASDRMLETIRQKMIGEVIRELNDLGLERGSMLVHVARSPNSPKRVNVYVDRNPAVMPLTASEYDQIVGEPPVRDDLHRANCADAGEPGHMLCGWCPIHGVPWFKCQCPEWWEHMGTWDYEWTVRMGVRRKRGR